MRRIGSLALAACMSATLAAVPVNLDLKDPSKLTASSAFAKNGNGGGGGNGGGNGGDGGGGGGGNGGGSDKSGGGEKSGGKDKSASKNTASRGKSETAHAKADTKEKKDPITKAFDRLFGKDDAKAKTKLASVEKSKPARKLTSPATTTAKLKQAPEDKLSAKLGSLNSLNRNYHAYMNSQAPRMAAVRAYVMAYAQFELENGVDAVPDDPALSDEALSAALLSATNKDINTALPGEPAVVDPEVMGWAKDVLGVGPSVGKIDQVRDELAAEQPTDVVEQPTEPDTEQPTDVVEQPTEPESELPTETEQAAVVE